jgi:isoleucyl-tRNA synthetase
MVTSLCKMLSPLLAFTADEAWDFVTGKTVAAAQQLTWQPVEFSRPVEEAAAWQRLLTIREQALPLLETARQQKTIGKALEAQIQLTGMPQLIEQLRPDAETLKELLNVSGLTLTDRPPAAERSESVELVVARAAGEKCERCWHWETDVGSDPEHPTLCARCAKIVQARTRDPDTVSKGR